MTKNFASDNNASIHPDILAAIARVNEGHALAYGADATTQSMEAKFAETFGEGAQVFPVFNGTAANVLSLQALTLPYHSVLCAETSHIEVDECGAPERYTGCKLVKLPVRQGKISVEDAQRALVGIGDQHHVQPRVLSIAQSTEYGTVYTAAELKALSAFARRNGLYFHMDGARIANACASLGLGLRELTRDCGVDVLSFGGTKNGAMGAEAVVFFDPKLCADFRFVRKQGMQLASKMRYISVQLETLLTGELWLRNARHANAMAKLLLAELRAIPEVRIQNEVHGNAIFVSLPKAVIPRIQKQFWFYVWREGDTHDEVRWMTSFDTTEADVRAFVKAIRDSI